LCEVLVVIMKITANKKDTNEILQTLR